MYCNLLLLKSKPELNVQMNKTWFYFKLLFGILGSMLSRKVEKREVSPFENLDLLFTEMRN